MLPVKDGRESLNMANLLATEHPISHASSSLTSDKHFSLALEAERSGKKIKFAAFQKQSKAAMATTNDANAVTLDMDQHKDVGVGPCVSTCYTTSIQV